MSALNRMPLLTLVPCVVCTCSVGLQLAPASDAYVIVVQAPVRQLLIKVIHSDPRLSVTDNFTLWMKRMVPLVGRVVGPVLCVVVRPKFNVD